MDFHIQYLIVGSLVCTIMAQHNLSPFGKVSQSSIYGDNEVRFGPENGINEPKSNQWINGDTVLCTHTAEKHPYNWWKIEFPSIVYISSVDIYYREKWGSRMDGFRLSVTNDPSDVEISEVCYKDKKDGSARITQTVDCYKMGKVLLYDKYTRDNKHGYPFIELCYVGINGCFYGYWGPGCNMSCPINCVGGNCFPENGTCVWGNLYENLALKSIATQIPQNATYPWSLAVDGNRTKSSCSKTEGSHALLQIDLLQLSIVTTIYINFEDLPVNLSFDIYASNTSVNENGNNRTLLYNGKQSLVELPEPVITRYLIYLPGSQNEQKSINICEFEARGCAAGMYGSSCNFTCPNNCIGACNIESGKCIFGCKNGWKGDFCDRACDEGYFGRNCSQQCSKNCLKLPCNHVTGACDGCKKGWTSYNCTEECGKGRYGINCSESCNGCVSNECDRVDGVCTNTTICNPGFMFDPKCKQVCDDWTFGYNCSENCHCRTKPCDKREGICKEGCAKGWMTDTCNTKCLSDGSFGYNCEKNCKTCFNMMCDSIDGNCTNGCLPGYIGTDCRQFSAQAQEDSDVSNVGVVGGVTAAVLAIIVAVVVIVIFTRRRSSIRKTNEREDLKTDIHNLDVYVNQSETRRDPYENVSVNPNKSTGSIAKYQDDFTTFDLKLDEDEIDHDDIDVNVYGNVTKKQSTKQYKIPIKELENAIKETRKNNGFQEEFELLPKGLMHPHSEGLKEINKNKNRFKTTWPYDHSRVILKGDSKHDYINASFIDSYTKAKAYIASQGPKTNTVKDFWHMVWQEGVGVIVMVTNLEEGGRPKCEQYWPSEINKDMGLDTYKLVMSSETRHSVYDHRCILITSKKTSKQRKVNLFHFTQWPDHGIPEKVKLVTFYRKVKSQSDSKDCPLLVHCSAGVGRTGTFIAIDSLYSLGKTNGEVDVMEYVQIMRKNRMNMIQTHEQYALVFEVLLELFTVPDTSIPTSDFCRIVEEQEKNKLPSNQKLYRKQFQKLQSLISSYTDDDYLSSNLPQNTNKNSYSSILAHDKYRPYLTSYARNRNDYINAVIIPGFSNSDAFFVTQCPLESTLVDFWTMVYDHDCEIIVLLDKPNVNAQICPDDDAPLVFEKFSVHKENEISETDMSVILEHKATNEGRKVRILEYSEWKEQELVPFPSIRLIKFYKEMKECDQNSLGKVTVVCRNGCSKCGLYVAISLVLEKMHLDNEIDIFQIVRSMQIRRPEFFTSYEQYEFCYKFVRDCLLEDESLYANM